MGRGINRFTFTLEYRTPLTGDNPELVDAERDPYFDAATCEAVFRLPEHLLKKCRQVSGLQFVIRILGDYLEDVVGLIPDVELLRGRAPTGNGIPGGLFLSWFRLVH
jgi:hypothetical protein